VSQLLGDLAAQGSGVDGKTWWGLEVHEYVALALKQHRAVVIEIADRLMRSHELSGPLLEEFCARFETVS
jgi:hypothetical protein